MAVENGAVQGSWLMEESLDVERVMMGMMREF